MGGRAKKVFQSHIYIVSYYALKVSVNGAMCVFVAHFRSSDTSESLLTSSTVNIHVSTNICVTGNNFILYKALVESYPPTKNTTDLTGMDTHCPDLKGQRRDQYKSR